LIIEVRSFRNVFWEGNYEYLKEGKQVNKAGSAVLFLALIMGVSISGLNVKHASADTVQLAHYCVEHAGDLTIEGDMVYNISDCTFNLTGRLLVKDHAHVNLQNAQVFLTCLPDQWNWISDLEHRSTGAWRAIMILVENLGKIDADNTTFVFSTPYPLQTLYHFIYISESAEARINDSMFVYTDGKGDVIESNDDSMVNITETNVITNQYTSDPSPGSGVVARGCSTVYVDNCSLDTAYCGGNSSVMFLFSNVTSITVYDNSTIDMTGSRVESLDISCPPNAYLTNVFATRLNVRNSTNVWAKGCHIQEASIGLDARLLLSQSEAWKVHTYSDGAVLFFYDLPFLGRVVLSLLGFFLAIVLVALTLIAVTILTIIYALRKKEQPKPRVGQ